MTSKCVAWPPILRPLATQPPKLGVTAPDFRYPNTTGHRAGIAPDSTYYMIENTISKSILLTKSYEDEIIDNINDRWLRQSSLSATHSA